ncbi:MAG: CBS domain-containing protein, partial [Bacteroidetes bacterium]|nr:CBS domain-containing protein [Bacteroidota bacterium]
MKEINNYKISSTSTIKKTIKKMDVGGIGFIVVVDKADKAIGVVSNGDVRRARLKGI